MRVLAFDLGLHVGWSCLEAGKKPEAGSFDIPRRAIELGPIARWFVRHAAPIIEEREPDVIVRATRFINRLSRPVNIGPYFGLSMRLDEMAMERNIRCGEVEEQEARLAFLGSVPRGSKAIKAAVKAACVQRGWPAKDEHACDAECIGAYALECLECDAAYKTTPLFQR